MDDCIFCRIIAREAPAHVIHEDERALVFLALENHPLVVSRAHIPDLFALDDADAAALMRAAARVARALKVGLGCDGVSLTQANGAAAGQDVFHLHLHLYPRWHGDGGRVAMPMPAVTTEAKARRCDQLRAALLADTEST